MYPDFSVSNQANKNLTDTETLANFGLCLAGYCPNLANCFIIQLRVGILFALKICIWTLMGYPFSASMLTVFLKHILHIVRMRSLKEMAWIEAVRIIATMKRQERFVKIREPHFQDKPMDIYRLALNKYQSIALRQLLKWPRLTAIGFDLKGFNKPLQMGLFEGRMDFGHFGTSLSGMSLASGGDTLGAF